MTAGALLLAAVLGAHSLPFHTELQATYPAADSTHAVEVREIRLRFSTPVQLALSTISVLGPQGVIRTADAVSYVPGSQERELRLALPTALTSGAYRVEWRTAGPDGHPLRGDFTFQVVWDPPADTATPGAPPAADSGPASPLPPGELAELAGGDRGQAVSEGRFLGALARWLLYGAMAAGLGGALFRTAVLPRLGTGDEALAVRAAAGRRMTALAWTGVVAGLAALPLALGVQAVQTFGGGGLAVTDLLRVLGSAWGGAWLLQIAGVALLGLGLLVARKEAARWGWLLAGVAGILLAVGAARAGHAADGGALLVAIQALHASAAAVWLGGLILVLWAGLSATREHPAQLPRLVDAFSPMALTAVALLVATGVLNSWDRLGGPADLLTSTFGRVLLLKLALFAGAAALGFHNWRTVRPALRQEARPGLLRVPAGMEALLGLAVLAATAVLVALPLP